MQLLKAAEPRVVQPHGSAVLRRFIPYTKEKSLCPEISIGSFGSLALPKYFSTILQTARRMVGSRSVHSAFAPQAGQKPAP
jgi:hypothetical protein